MQRGELLTSAGAAGGFHTLLQDSVLMEDSRSHISTSPMVKSAERGRQSLESGLLLAGFLPTWADSDCRLKSQRPVVSSVLLVVVFVFFILFSHFLFCFETESHCIVLNGLKLCRSDWL